MTRRSTGLDYSSRVLNFGNNNTAVFCGLSPSTPSESARELNQLDQCLGRKVWYNFWDTKLTYERSYLARLNYVHQNAVRHGLVPVANQYPWCSAAWFERTASPAAVKTIYGFKIDRLNVDDDY